MLSLNRFSSGAGTPNPTFGKPTLPTKKTKIKTKREDDDAFWSSLFQLD